ncbi:MAG: hypothetical protein ACQESP_01180 [Candidatus Muiribacteriota bacterium]
MIKLKIIFFLLILLLCWQIEASNILIQDGSNAYLIPESYFNNGIGLFEKALARKRMTHLEFTINPEALSLKGKYRIFPFRVDFHLFRKDDREYILRINSFKFYGLIGYSRSKLANIVVKTFSSNKGFSEYINLESSGNYIHIEFKKNLSEIFPEELEFTE